MLARFGRIQSSTYGRISSTTNVLRYFSTATTIPTAKIIQAPPKRILGRNSNNIKMGIVGMPNIGKSLIFNCLTSQQVPSENYPFCTIDPSSANVEVPDSRINKLRGIYNSKLTVPAMLTITDIAGLVKGASEGLGLGNEFLSHISAVDAIAHLVRIFPNPQDGVGKTVQHVEGSVDPVRDMEIISYELLAKDKAKIAQVIAKFGKNGLRSPDPHKVNSYKTAIKAMENLEKGLDIREVDWNDTEAQCLLEFGLLSSKPIIYLLNCSAEEYLSQYSPLIQPVREWIEKRSPGATTIMFSGDWEADLELMEGEELAEYIRDTQEEYPIKEEIAIPLIETSFTSHIMHDAIELQKKSQSMIPAIVAAGFNSLNLIQYFTAGPEQIHSWTIRNGTNAPGAAGVIHTDFEKNFVAAEVMSYEDLMALGDEDAVKKQGKLKIQGRGYILEDGDICHFKHTAKR